MTAKNRFILFHGWLSDPAGQPSAAALTIATVAPPLVISPMMTSDPKRLNLSRQVHRLFRRAGIRFFAYVPTGYGARNHDHVWQDINEVLAYEIDGVFLDEVPDYLVLNPVHRYYADISNTIRRSGCQVVMNTGVSQNGESIMDAADYLMVEHGWRDFAINCSWRYRYPAERIMGISSNEPGAYGLLHQAILSSEDAARSTREAWSRGIGWHFSTDIFTELPFWLPEYWRRLDT